MRKYLLCAALAAVIASPAAAADMPIKAAPYNPFAYPTTSGFYFGIGTMGGGGNANVSTNAAVGLGLNSASLTTNQISANGIVGYAWNVPNSAMFAAVEGWFGYNNFNGSVPGLSFTGPVTFTQRVMFGAPLSTIASLFPSFNLTVPPFPPLPAGQTVSNVKPYLFGSISEDDVSLNFGAMSNKDWRIAPGFGVGALGQLTNATEIDVFAMMKFPQKGFTIGPGAGIQVSGGIDTQYLAGLAIKW
jgi:hypothetical protein